MGNFDEELAACLAVVREVVARVDPGPRCRELLARVAAGEPVADLLEPADLEGRRATDRARGWAATAVYNLGVLARHDRGWKAVPESVRSAAEYALPGLSAPRTAPVGRLPARRRPGAEHARRVGALAFAELRRARAGFGEPGEGGAHPAAAEFLKTWGGLEVEEDWVCGGGAAVAGRRGLAPVMAAGDITYYLAKDGSAWAEDAIEDPAPRRFADDGDTMLARALLFRIIDTRRQRGRARFWDDARGPRLARAARLPAIREANDGLAKAWGNETALVIEHRLGRKPATAAAVRGGLDGMPASWRE